MSMPALSDGGTYPTCRRYLPGATAPAIRTPPTTRLPFRASAFGSRAAAGRRRFLRIGCEIRRRSRDMSPPSNTPRESRARATARYASLLPHQDPAGVPSPPRRPGDGHRRYGLHGGSASTSGLRGPRPWPLGRGCPIPPVPFHPPEQSPMRTANGVGLLPQPPCLPFRCSMSRTVRCPSRQSSAHSQAAAPHHRASASDISAAALGIGRCKYGLFVPPPDVSAALTPPTWPALPRLLGCSTSVSKPSCRRGPALLRRCHEPAAAKPSITSTP